MGKITSMLFTFKGFIYIDMQKVQELRQRFSPSESQSYTLLIPLE